VALGFAANADRVSFTGAMPTTFTITGWAYIAADLDNYATFCRLRSNVEGTVVTWSTTSDGLGGPGIYSTAGVLEQSLGFAVAAWRRVAISRTDTGDTVGYVATPGGAVEADAGSLSNLVPAGITFGGRGPGDTSDPLNGRTAHMRLHAAILTESEILAEWASTAAVRTADLWADWWMIDDLLDHSGNGRHLVAGTNPVTFESGPIAPAVLGELAAVLPAMTAALAGTSTVSGALGATLPAITAALAGQAVDAGELAATLPALTAALTGDAVTTGQLDAVLPALTAQFSGGQGSTTGELDATLPGLVAALVGTASTPGVLAAVLPALTAAFAETPPRGEIRAVYRAAASSRPVERAAATMKAGV
jgi:hypothetical protein